MNVYIIIEYGINIYSLVGLTPIFNITPLHIRRKKYGTDTVHGFF